MIADDVPVRLRAQRRARLWSQKEMARRLAEAADEYTRARLPTRESLVRMVRGWESGDHRPEDPYPILYCRAFGMTESELFDRRTVMVDLAAVAVWEAVGKDYLPARPSRRVAPEMADYFQQQLQSHYQTDAFLGPQHLIGAVAAQYQVIAESASRASGDLGRELLRLGAVYAAFAGWLCQDAGDLPQAAYWLSQDLEMAHRAHDGQLVSHALTNKAMLATDTRDAKAAVDLAAVALAGPRRLIPKVQVLANQQAAHGYALLQERDSCDRHLDAAAELIDRIDDDHLWGNAVRTPQYVKIQRATCYGRLGLANEAARLWEEIIPAIPATSRRDMGVFRARQAAALAVVPEPEGATAAAADAERIAHETGSVRLTRELLAVQTHAQAWADSRHGKDLADMVARLTEGTPDGPS